LGLRAIGHAGTLDPLASGLLVLLLGEGTKISDYILESGKSYDAKIRLGVSTNTMDMTGEVVAEASPPTDFELIAAAVAAMAGDLDLEVPAHSAVKVGGRKLYEYARREQEVELPRRTMSFYDVKAVEIDTDARGTFVRVALSCSKGSFIRAWAHELGRRLGCGGAVEELRRLRSEPFCVDDAITLDTLDQAWRARERRHGSILGRAWVPLKDALPAFPSLWVEGRDEALIRNGQVPKSAHAELLRYVIAGERPPPVKAVSRDTEDLVALLAIEPGEFYKIRRVFLRA
jgi:tRNA pseudouridine55 synthase